MDVSQDRRRVGQGQGRGRERAGKLWGGMGEAMRREDPRGFVRGCDLIANPILMKNEFDAHRLIEKCDSALTVQKMRQVLKEIDVDFNKMVSLSEFMIYK